MKLASFLANGAPSWGVVDGDAVVDVGAVLRSRLPDLKSAIAAGALPSLAEHAGNAPRRPVASVTWLPVIPNPDKILCIGLNYETHRQETGRSEVETSWRSRMCSLRAAWEPGSSATEQRGVGMGAAMASSRFGQVLSPLLIAWLIDLSLGTDSILYVIAAMPVVAAGFVLVFGAIRSARTAPAVPAE